MILMLAFLSFWTPFWTSSEEQQQRIHLEKDCFFIQNICFRDYDFSHVDLNRDLVLSFPESKLHRLELFLEFDKNSDGKITFQEFLNASLDIKFKTVCLEKKIKDSYEKKAKREFDKFDLNLDTRITSVEFESYGTRVFDEIDTNHDNYVSGKEIRDYNSTLN